MPRGQPGVRSPLTPVLQEPSRQTELQAVLREAGSVTSHYPEKEKQAFMLQVVTSTH